MTEQNKEQKVIVAGVLEHKGKYLIVRRSKDEEFFPGEYEFPAGSVEFGESAEAALTREFMEETGLDVEVEGMLRSFNWIGREGRQHAIEFVYRVRLKNQDATDVVLDENHDEFAWIDMSEVQQYDIKGEILGTFKALGYKEKEQIELPLKDDKKTTSGEIHIFTDGGSRGNPGPSASGYVLMTPDEEIIEEGGEYLGITTNNQAEYQAVKLALEAVAKYEPKKVRFFIDSLLVVNQMKGTYKIRNRDLWPIHQNIKDLAKNYDEVTFTHVRREFNKLADAKVNEVLDSYEHR